MQDSKPTGKCSKAKSNLGVYVGQSPPKHSGNVPIVYNTTNYRSCKPTIPRYYEDIFSAASTTLDPVETRTKLNKHFDTLFESHEWIRADNFVPASPDQEFRCQLHQQYAR